MSFDHHLVTMLQKLNLVQGLGKGISRQERSGHMLHRNATRLEMVTNEVVPDIDMFGPPVVDGVAHHVKRGHVVPKQRDARRLEPELQ